MKKLLSIGLVGLCALTLVGCGNNETDSSANASKDAASEKVEKDLSNKELKSIYTSLSDSFIDLINAMSSDKAAKDKVSETEKSVDNAIELSKEVIQELEGETSDAAVDLLKYATTLNTFATDTKDLNFDNYSELTQELGRLQTSISKNHFDGFIPESVKNMTK